MTVEKAGLPNFVEVDQHSRLNFASFVKSDGNILFFLNQQFPEIPESPQDLFITITPQTRIDMIAFQFYGDANLWWVIAVANNMKVLPFDLLIPNKIIRIPPQDIVFSLFSK